MATINALDKKSVETTANDKLNHILETWKNYNKVTTSTKKKTDKNSKKSDSNENGETEKKSTETRKTNKKLDSKDKLKEKSKINKNADSVKKKSIEGSKTTKNSDSKDKHKENGAERSKTNKKLVSLKKNSAERSKTNNNLDAKHKLKEKSTEGSKTRENSDSKPKHKSTETNQDKTKIKRKLPDNEKDTSKRPKNPKYDSKGKKIIRLPNPLYNVDEPLIITLKKYPHYNMKHLKDIFVNFKNCQENETHYILKYSTKEHALVDLKTSARARKAAAGTVSTPLYYDNRYLINNLSYKETEESITEAFSKFGTVERVILRKNKDGYASGKAMLTFAQGVKIEEEVILNNKIIGITRIKEDIVDQRSIFMSHIKKTLQIATLRKVLANHGCKPSDIRIRYDENKRNKGYGFLEFKTAEEAKIFESKFPQFKSHLGDEVYCEYAKDKKSAK